MDKTQAYCDLLKLFSKMLDPQEQTKLNKSKQAKKKLGVEMALIGMNISLLGSDEVVKLYIDWRASALEGGIEKMVFVFSKMMLAMRTDLTPTTKINNHDMMTDTFVTLEG